MEVYQETWSQNYQLHYLIDNVLLLIQAVYQSICRQEFLWRNCLGKVFFMSLEREEAYQVESEQRVFDRHHMQGEILTGGAQGTHKQCVRQVLWEDDKYVLGKLENVSKRCQALCNCPCNTEESSSIYWINLQITCIKAVNLMLHDISKEWNHV